MEIAEMKTSRRIFLCMREFNLEKKYSYIKPVKHINELPEDFKDRITNLSLKYDIQEKTIYSIIGYRYQ